MSNFIMDYFKYCVFGCAVPLIVNFFDLESLTKDGNNEFLWSIFLLYGVTTVAFSYAFSFT